MTQKRSSIPQKPTGVLAPLSLAQQRLWFIYQYDPQSPTYNISRSWRIKGSLNPQVLKTNLDLIVARHESLRTTFQEIDGQSIQIIQPTFTAPFQEWDWSAYSPAQLEAEIDRFLIDEPLQPFDLLTGPLLRFTLIRCAPDDHVFVFTVHHMVFDGTSLKVFCQELSQGYQATLHGQPGPFSPLPIQYQDYAYWQQAQVTEEKLASQVVFWKQHLQGAPLVLELPSDGVRPKDNSGPGSYLTFTLPPHLISNLKQLIQPQGMTMFMALLAVFQILLSRYTGQRDILVGTPIAGRTHTDLEELIGFLVNTLVLRTHMVGQPTFLDVLSRVRKTCLAAYRHQDLPFEKLVEVLKPERDPSRAPVVQAIFQLRQLSDLRLTFPEIVAQPFPVKKRTGNFDLHMICEETESGMQGFLYYPQALYSDSLMTNFAKHYEVLLEELVANPDRLVSQVSCLTETETQQLLLEWNATATDYPQATSLPQLFEAQVAARPEAVAVVCEEQQLTYAQLEQRTNQLAHYLRRQGVGPEVRVGVCLDRSVDLVISLVAILKAGGAYVPLEPSYPPERLAYMLTDAHPSVLLTHQALLSDLPSYEGTLVCLDTTWPSLQQESPAALQPSVSPDHLAYIIYTSGSTGQPKGAMNTHRGIGNRLQWMQATYHLTADDRVVQKTPFSFDVSVWEFFWPLLAGASLVLARPGGQQDSAYLVELLVEHQVTTVHFVPSQLQVMLEQGLNRCQSVQRVICSGEALSAALQSAFFMRMEAALHNLYGPTEAAVDVTAWACHREDPHSTVSIGRPIANTTILLLDRFGQLVPVGVLGELYIGGCQLARGYLGRPDLTAEKFLPHPCSSVPGARLYRTGDRTRYRKDGTIEFLGRLDYQIKLRGYRIELGEIEAGLSQQPGIHEAVVLCREDTPGEKQLVAYITTDGGPVDVPALRAVLQGHLPSYMVPSAFVWLGQLPLTPNGKINRKALPAPEGAARLTGRSYVAPRTPLEELLAAVWQEVLQVERIGIHDNFFELGGHSLFATRVINRLHNVLNLNIPLRSLFDYPVIVELAMEIDAQLRDIFADSHEERT